MILERKQIYQRHKKHLGVDSIVGIIIRCVEPIMYNERVLSFRQKPLSIVLLPLLINIFMLASWLLLGVILPHICIISTVLSVC